jgi:hypothetical protein
VPMTAAPRDIWVAHVPVGEWNHTTLYRSPRISPATGAPCVHYRLLTPELEALIEAGERVGRLEKALRLARKLVERYASPHALYLYLPEIDGALGDDPT